MNHLVLLRHPKSLDLGRPPTCVSDHLKEHLALSQVVLTFRRPSCANFDAAQKHIVDGSTRLPHLTPDVTLLLHILDDSPFATNIVWDLSHNITVGSTIIFADDLPIPSPLDYAYYEGCFECKQLAKGVVLYRKLQPLPIEQDRGLNRWTFGIPVGPGDSTLLNKCVERIKQLDLPETEILLCGEPPSGFKYAKDTRVIGTHLTGTPVPIAQKKNLIAESAEHPNLCLLHDRVFLPSNFREIILRYGDNYAINTLHCLYFEDKLNLLQHRYSDYGFTPRLGSLDIAGQSKNFADNNRIAGLSPSTFAIAEHLGKFVCGNPRRPALSAYVNGSLYIVKRSLWRLIPQDGDLCWAEFEDVEYGLRCARLGVPHLVNPFGLAQTMISRPILLNLGRIPYINERGVETMPPRRSRLLSNLLPKKPLLKVTASLGRASFFAFVQKYCSASCVTAPHARFATHASVRLREIVQAFHSLCLPGTRSSLRIFITDLERLIYHDQLPYRNQLDIVEGLVTRGRKAIPWLYHNSPLIQQLAARPRKGFFASSMDDFFPKKSLLIRLGSLVTSVRLGRHVNSVLGLRLSMMDRYKAIMNSTPFR
jgi:hypothetical protein